QHAAGEGRVGAREQTDSGADLDGGAGVDDRGPVEQAPRDRCPELGGISVNQAEDSEAEQRCRKDRTAPADGDYHAVAAHSIWGGAHMTSAVCVPGATSAILRT